MHTNHSATGNGSLAPYPSWFGTVCYGVSGGDQSQNTVTPDSNQCASVGCHGLDLTVANRPAVIEDYNYSVGGNPDDPTGSNNAVTLVGTWRYRASTQYTGNRMSYNNVSGSSLTVTFSGSRIELISDKDPYRGRADIFLDGAKVATIDCYSSSTVCQATVYSSPMLAAGQHTISVWPLAQKSEWARADFVVVDAFKVYSELRSSIAPKCVSCHVNAATGHGAEGSHLVHIDPSDPRGPGGLGCSDCHNTSAFPTFSDGQGLAATTVCDTCHSPGGSYNGVDSSAGSVGAKNNWDSAVYETTATLQAGKEKWCVGCHDGDKAAVGEEPSRIGGAYAPPVGGDPGSSLYGTGWGYYKTGHGVPSSTVLPSNGYTPGAGLECDECHDSLLPHIDGERRSYDATSSAAQYRSGYRLDLVGGAEPMSIPWAKGSANDDTKARLCYRSGCHSYSDINGTSTQRTNFWLSGGTYYYDAWQYNMHEFHLDFDNQLRWVSDYSSNAYPGDSQISCPTCHNVHGSKYLAMTSDGSLTSEVYERRPGLRMWYRNLGVSVWNANDANPPAPEDVPQAASDGWIWRPATASAVCSHCHGANQNTWGFGRALWQSVGIVPTLAWTGQPGYTDDGLQPDTGSASDTFRFKVKYTDGGNDAPSYVALQIDRNDDGDYADAGESVLMNPDDALDATYYNGNTYSVDIALAKASDNVLSYRFQTSDGVTGVVTSQTRVVNIVNAAPQLPWTGEAGYASDGVNPNSGTSGVTDYEFRITYRDADGEPPVGGAPSLYVDKNDDGDYGDVGEVVTMSPVAGGDYVAGKRYTHTSQLTYGIDGLISYYFRASDGIDSLQSSTSAVTVVENVNQAPVLGWTGETAYASDGVDPESQAGGKPFYFRVEYSDANNDPPGVSQVWVDLDDNGSYGAGEKFSMNDPVVGAAPIKIDGDYSNGEICGKKVYVPMPVSGDGVVAYCFSFTDGVGAAATGEPQDDGNVANDKTLAVFAALNVPTAPYPTIQAAVNAATTGQTVLVADGTYAGFDYVTKDITVESINGSGSTFIQGSGTLVVFNNGSNSTLRGFTVRNGTTGISSNNSDVIIRECVIDSNSGAGIDHLSGSGFMLLIEDSMITNNHPGIIGNNGGGRITMRRTSVSGNSVSGNGAGLSSNGSSQYMFDECTFSNNIAGGSGGALYNVSATFTMVVRDCIIEGNRANGGSGGGMAFNSGTNITFERSVIRGNYASGNGGGVWHQGGTYTYTNDTFSGNYAEGDGGGVMMATNGGSPTFNFCTFSGNSARYGGALYVNWPAAAQAKVLSCIMHGDDARSSATLDEIDGGNYLNTRVQYTDMNQAYSSFNSAIGNYTSNPSFITPVAASLAPTVVGDYHVQMGSLCEGRADPGSTLVDDIDRQVRPQGARDSGSDEIPGS